MRRGRPGLVGMAARTAVVVGTAGAVSNHQQNKQMEKQQGAADAQQQAYDAGVAAAQQQAAMQPAPVAAPAAPAEDPTTAKLEQLAALHSQGILTDEEFASAKAKALGL